MANDPNKLSQFWQELKRRKVTRTITVYAAAAFVILELVSIIVEPLRLPEWTLPMIIVLLCVGFIIAVILSWIYDINPDGGIEKTEPAEEKEPVQGPVTSSGWKIATYLSAIVILGLLAINLFGKRDKVKIDESLEKSVAVLLFRNLSGDSGQDFICEGLTEEVINNLYQIEALDRIPSITTILNYKDTDKKLIEIADELQVNYILDCSYKRMEGLIRFTVQLIEARNDKQVWLDNFDKPSENISAIPSDIALQIAEQLKAYLSGSEKDNIRKIYTKNLVAYNLYHQANFLKRKARDKEGLESSITLLQESINQDPEFALAYTSLADSYLLQYWFKFEHSKDLLKKAKDAIEAALRIDNKLSEAYIELADYYYSGFLDYPKALEQLEKAAEYVPNHSRIDFMTAVIYRRMGKWEEAVKYFEKALTKDPRSQLIIHNLSETYTCLGEYQEALDRIEIAKMIDPFDNITYEVQIITYILRDGNTKEARKVLEEADILHIKDKVLAEALYINPISINLFDGNLQESLDFISSQEWTGVSNRLYHYPNTLFEAWIYDLMNSPEVADLYYDSTRLKLDSLLVKFPDDPRYLGAMGIACAGLGEKELAIGFVQKAVEDYSMEKDAFFGMTRIEELAWVLVMLEEYDAALEQIEILLTNPGTYSAPMLMLDPKWLPLCDHPEFIRLINKYS
jgi:adenylate cyclase